MKNTNRRILATTRALFPMTVAGIWIIVSGMRLLLGDTNTVSLQNTPEVQLLLCCPIFILCSVNYWVSTNCMWMCVLGIPVKRISWRKVTSVTCIAGNDRLSPKKVQQQIFITIHPCLPYSHISQSAEKFAYAHPFRSVLIRIPHGKEEQYLEAFRTAYGHVDMPET